MRKTSLTLSLMLPAVLLLSGLSTSVCAALAADPAPQVEQKAATKKEKLIIQVSDKDPGKWYLALNNARNVQAALGADQVDIEIVAYGPGVAMLEMDSEAGNNVAQALASGVKIIACKNSMKAAHLTDADMLANIGYEVSGVVEIMRRQQQGYNYVRP